MFDNVLRTVIYKLVFKSCNIKNKIEKYTLFFILF